MNISERKSWDGNSFFTSSTKIPAGVIPVSRGSVVLGCGLAHSSAKDRGVGTPLSMFDPGTLLPDEEQGQRTYYISLYSEGIRLILHLIGSE